MSALDVPSPTDLTTAELQSLERQNLCLGSVRPGKRTVSGAFLSPPPSNSGSWSSSSSSSASVRFRNFDAGNLRSFDIPVTAESADALEFIGFIPQAAGQIWQNYHNRASPARNTDSLIDYVYGHVSMLASPRLADLSLRQAMHRLGLTQKIQDALLDSRFSYIFWTETLLFWVKDTLRINYATLLQLQQRLKNHARSGGRKQKRASLEGAFQRPETTIGQPSTQSAQIVMTVSTTPQDYNLPANHIALESEGPLLTNHLVLYKGKAATEMLDSEWLEADGTLNMAAIASYAGGDFNHSRVTWYWTPQKAVAEEYRQWAATRCSWSETWLIRIQIPNDFINRLNRKELWYGMDWKEYVWYCKKKRGPPAKFDALWRDGGADIIRGHICTGTTDTITRIKKEDVQRDITSENVMINSATNERAIQYVFMQEDSARFMGESIRGKIHIEITGASQLSDSP